MTLKLRVKHLFNNFCKRAKSIEILFVTPGWNNKIQNETRIHSKNNYRWKSNLESQKHLSFNNSALLICVVKNLSRSTAPSANKSSKEQKQTRLWFSIITSFTKCNGRYSFTYKYYSTKFSKSKRGFEMFSACFAIV